MKIHMSEKNKTKKKEKQDVKRRSMVERAEEIFKFIENQYEVFPKSRLKEIGINPSSAENWLKLIEFIQNQPRIRLVESKNNLLVEKVENKYQAMIRKVITDESVSLEDRLTLLNNYLPSLVTRERLGLERMTKERSNSELINRKLKLREDMEKE
jgi:hypothetical protein